MTRPLRCFILAAGLGERMRPITNHIPKPFLPIAGTPLIETIINRILKTGIEQIGVNSHHLHEYISDWSMNSVSGKRVTIFHEPEVLDTGGGLRNAIRFLDGADFLVHNGDIVSDIDLSALINRHRDSGNIATLAVHDSEKFNNLALNADASLRTVLKGTSSQGDKLYAFTGIAVYSAEFLQLLPEGKSGLVNAWQLAIDAGHTIGTVNVSGCYWNDIGTPAAYVAAVMHELRSRGESLYIDSSAQISDTAEIDGHIVLESGCIAVGTASLRDIIMLPHAEAIDGSIHKNCILGAGYKVPVDESSFAEKVDGKGILIGVGGSDRKYYRVDNGNRMAVLMECRKDDPDYKRHIEYTYFFRKYGIPVPDLISTDEDHHAALFEDLGDISLYSWLQLKRPDNIVETVYRKILDILARLHCEASDNVQECRMLEERVFDYDHLRWETEYFIERFVKGLRNMHINDGSDLNDEFHRLAARTDAFSKRIIHRDFQSQNIMIAKDCSPHIIDFQGARMAPPAYDLASILWDPYAPLLPDARKRLLDYYLDAVKPRAASWMKEDEFMDSLLCCRLQRHMQALGAYGFLSTEKNKPYFLKHVPEALRLLIEDAKEARAEFPSLFRLVNKLL